MHPLGIILTLLAAPLAQTAAPKAGQHVLLKQSDVAVSRDFKVQPPALLDCSRDFAVQVVDVQGDCLWIYTPRGRGWVQRSDVLLPDEAVAYFSSQINANASNAEAWGRRGVARYLLGDAAGIFDLAEANRLSPDDARWFYHKARYFASAADEGRYGLSPPVREADISLLLQRALADATRAAGLEPSNATMVVLQGSIWLQQGNVEKVRESAEAALRLDPNCADAYSLRAMVCAAGGAYDRALADYGKAIEINPGHGDAYNNRMLLLWRLQAFDRVIEDATACLRLNVRPAQAHRFRGLAWYAKRDADKAIADLDVSLQLEPARKDSLMARAGARQMKGELAAAVDDMERAAASAQDDLTIPPLLACGQMKCRNWTTALATLQQWATRAPDDPRPHGGLADLYATCPDSTLRDGKKAVEHGNRACELSQWKNPHALDTLAAAYAEAGDFASAIRWEKTALEDAIFNARVGTEAQARLQLYEAGQAYHRK